MERLAHISRDGKYRYMLVRRWGKGYRYLCFVMLNPSTADALVDDATIRKCIGWAKRFGYDGIIVVNLFAYRATNPEALKQVVDPVGPHNDKWILYAVECAAKIICAWGNNGKLLDRNVEVLKLMRWWNLYCFKLSKTGQPVHPLYQSYKRKLIRLR